ncbi:gluconokinase [Anthocerotibacter panamensis]|uniref:gluconokinase n=1 Tax=Anthocerotibacter panamensis TaxID=2857077 RepID=UPI001C407CB4|nr:gluconokinase [Anthocerotibacter panamensis]
MPITVIVVIGVTGSGKTTVGRMLAEALGWEFSDADDVHPAANIEKMQRGIPLTDQDRAGWLDVLKAAITVWLNENRKTVLACSALKAQYRNLLQSDRVCFVYLHGSFALIQARLVQRQGHFMPDSLLQSQFDALEEPTDALAIDISLTPEAIVQEIRRGLNI